MKKKVIKAEDYDTEIDLMKRINKNRKDIEKYTDKLIRDIERAYKKLKRGTVYEK